MEKNEDMHPGQKPAGGYRVGYKKPPTEFQFKKGEKRTRRSPKKKKEEENVLPFYKALKDLMNRPVYVTEGGRRKSVSFREAAFAKFGQISLEDPKFLIALLKFDLQSNLTEGNEWRA